MVPTVTLERSQYRYVFTVEPACIARLKNPRASLLCRLGDLTHQRWPLNGCDVRWSVLDVGTRTDRVEACVSTHVTIITADGLRHVLEEVMATIHGWVAMRAGLGELKEDV